MNDKDKLRIGDSDREVVSRLLKSAVDEGRLSLAEYDERLQRIFEAKTVGDLTPITGDLMGLGRTVVSVPGGDLATPVRAGKVRRSGTPAWIKWMWFGWSVPVLLCSVIAVILMVTGADQDPFWPLWVAGPLGAPMLSVTLMERFMIRPTLDRQRAERESRRGFTSE